MTHGNVSKIEDCLKYSSLFVRTDRPLIFQEKSRLTLVVLLSWFLQNFLSKKSVPSFPGGLFWIVWF